MVNKEKIAVVLGLLLVGVVFGNALYQVYFTNRENTVEFKVFEAVTRKGKSGTQVLTWGVGKFFFLGNWTGQFNEGHTYRVTYVRQSGYSKHILVVLEWEEVT